MVKFETFFAQSAFDLSSRNSLVSEDLFKNILKENRCFAIVASKNKIDLAECVKHANGRKFYSMLFKFKNGISNAMVFVQKNNENEQDFKEAINQIYSKNQNIGIIYRGLNALKVIKECDLEVYGIEKENYEFFTINLSRVMSSDVKILGIEIPCNENVITMYRKIGCLVPSSLIAEDCKNIKNVL